MASTHGDYQVNNVYEAGQRLCAILDKAKEWPTQVIAGSTVQVREDRKFSNLTEIQGYVNGVTTKLGIEPVTVRARDKKNEKADKNGTAHYEPWSNTIAIPMRKGGKWAQREVVVLHEVAHHLTRVKQAEKRYQPHGPEFAGEHLALVERFVPDGAGFILRVLYHEHGVHWV